MDLPGQEQGRALPTEKAAGQAPVLIWDVAIRILHWSLVLLLGFSWYSAEQGQMDWHRWSGYTILALILFRLLWGFVGSSTARFASFVRQPAAVMRYARSLHRREPDDMIGHNPLGAISVLALILIMGFQVITGLFAVDVDGIESGPWSVHVSFDTGRWLAGLHHLNFTIIQVLVAFHVAAILFHLFYKRENLVLPMITGKKHARVDSASMTAVSPVRLAICVAVAAGLTYLLINF